MKNDYLTFPKFRAAIFLVLALPVLYAISRYNYSLFHSLADGLSIVTAACVFVIIWNSRHLLDNDYFLYVGITFLFWAFLDFMHLLGNKNMGVFPAYGNLGPAFYVASRYILGISLMIAPLFINRKLNITLIFAVYSLITLLIMLSILYWQIFPVCIVDGMGLTPFKVVSDYIICLLLLGSIGLMLSKRRSFDSRVLLLILSSIILSIATGLSFTLYTDPFGIMNMIGHLFQIASFYLVYLAFIKTSLSKPQDILYRKLKLSEKALRESQQQLTDIIEFLPDATLAIDKEGRVIIWNKAIEKMTGVPAAEMIGKGDYAYTIPFYGEARPQLMDLVFDNHDEIAVKYPKITRQGSSIMAEAFCSALYNNKGAWVVAKASPLHDNSGNVIGAIESIRDITAKKQMEESLKTNLQHFQAILAHLNDGVLVLNDDNQVAFANQTFCNLFDLVVLPADILGLPALEIIKKIGEVYANPSDAVARIQEILAKGQPVYCEEVAIRGERTYMRDYVPITIDGERVGRLWQHYDITHRKQMEEALRETNAYLENLINYANAPIIVWDTQFRITRFNHAFEFLTGRSEAEVLGKSLELLFPSALTKDSMALIRKTLSGERWETVEIKILHRDESVRTVLWNSATLFAPDGQTPIATIAQGQDITKRKQAEAEKDALDAQNRQLQKAESLGRMAGAIVHHFNNMLHAIIGNMQLAIRRLPRDADSVKYITAAMQAAHDAEAITSQTLTYMGNTSNKLEPLDLCDVCRLFLPKIQAAIPKNVTLETDLPPCVPTIIADANQMQQVLTNLVTNAWEAVGDGHGIIRLRIKAVSAADIPTIHIPSDWRPQNSVYVCLEVSDTGSGIAHSDIENLFDPFFSIKFIGRGLGLAVVLGITKVCHGAIAVQSEPGQGSTFCVFLPAIAEHAVV